MTATIDGLDLDLAEFTLVVCGRTIEDAKDKAEDMRQRLQDGPNCEHVSTVQQLPDKCLVPALLVTFRDRTLP